MSYANRGELKQDVRDWLAEQGTTVLPDRQIERCIGFVENDLNWNTWGPQQKRFRVFDMQEVKYTIITEDDEEYVSLPDGWLSMRYVVQTTGEDKKTLVYATPEDFINAEDIAGDPYIYTYSNQQLRVKTKLQSGDRLEMGYYQEIPALAQDTDTNWLLQKAPKIYLSGTLAHTGTFLQGTELADLQRYENAYITTVLGMITQDMRTRTGEGPFALGQHERVA